MSDPYAYLKSKEMQDKRTAGIRRYWANPENRKKKLEQMHNDEARAKRSQKLQDYHQQLKQETTSE